MIHRSLDSTSVWPSGGEGLKVAIRKRMKSFNLLRFCCPSVKKFFSLANPFISSLIHFMNIRIWTFGAWMCHAVPRPVSSRKTFKLFLLSSLASHLNGLRFTSCLCLSSFVIITSLRLEIPYDWSPSALLLIVCLVQTADDNNANESLFRMWMKRNLIPRRLSFRLCVRSRLLELCAATEWKES